MKKMNFILFLFFLWIQSYSQKQKASVDGFTISANAGTFSGGLGVLVQYQYRLDLFTFLSPFAGTGANFGGQDLKGLWQGYAFGMNVEMGKYHRVLGGITYGTRGVGFETKNNEIVNKHLMVGPSAIIGYKGIHASGWEWHINVGLAYIKNPIAINDKFYRSPTAGIGTGYKF